MSGSLCVACRTRSSLQPSAGRGLEGKPGTSWLESPLSLGMYHQVHSDFVLTAKKRIIHVKIRIGLYKSRIQLIFNFFFTPDVFGKCFLCMYNRDAHPELSCLKTKTETQLKLPINLTII